MRRVTIVLATISLAVLCHTATAQPADTDCAPVASLPQMCPSSLFTFPVPRSVDQTKAGVEAEELRNTLVRLVMKATIYKKQHCMAALTSLACYKSFPKCSTASTSLYPCQSMCNKAASLCGVKPSDLKCNDLFPQTAVHSDCEESKLLDLPPCAVPSRDEVKFCNMVDYPAGRSFYGDNFAEIDRMASDAYASGSLLLPSAVCKGTFKYLLCESYFRKCDIDGIEMPPCRESCAAYDTLDCAGVHWNKDGPSSRCAGPQYSDTHCTRLPTPVFPETCGPAPTMSFCDMIDYPLSSLVDGPGVDHEVHVAYEQTVAAIKSEGRSMTAECMRAMKDFSCGSTLRMCGGGESNGVVPPCRSMCTKVLESCGLPATNTSCAALPPDGDNCFTIPTSSRRFCIADWMCGNGEYCRKSGMVKGVCLASH